MVNTAWLKHFIASQTPRSKHSCWFPPRSKHSSCLLHLLTCASPSAICRSPVSQKYCCSPMHSSDIFSSKTNAASLCPNRRAWRAILYRVQLVCLDGSIILLIIEIDLLLLSPKSQM